MTCDHKAITRETLVSNKVLITKAIEMLGLRVSVAECQMHVKSLYQLMEIPCPCISATFSNQILVDKTCALCMAVSLNMCAWHEWVPKVPLRKSKGGFFAGACHK